MLNEEVRNDFTQKKGSNFKNANCSLELFICSWIDTWLCTNEVLNFYRNKLFGERVKRAIHLANIHWVALPCILGEAAWLGWHIKYFLKRIIFQLMQVGMRGVRHFFLSVKNSQLCIFSLLSPPHHKAVCVPVGCLAHAHFHVCCFSVLYLSPDHELHTCKNWYFFNFFVPCFLHALVSDE